MSSTIQNYYFKDLSSYGKGIRLNTSISELMKRQNGGSKGSLKIISRDDAATVEISELARTMYGASKSISEKQEPADQASQKQEPADQASQKQEPADTASGQTDPYDGLSGVERELKELEDYIAAHPADASIDVLRNGSLRGTEGKHLADHALDAAEKEYTEAFADAAEGFADFSMKITYGNYSGNDVSVNDLNPEAVDKMEAVYQSYKKQIESEYEGEDRAGYLSRLDEAYNAVFEEKIISPVKSAYDDKLVFFKPDSEETIRSIRAASESKESLQEMISGYAANQAVNRKQYTALSDGTRDFYDLADNKSLWHDTAAVRGILTDSMNVYASVKEVRTGAPDYLSAKAAADKIAKKISDQYAENLAYQAEKLGFKKDGEDMEWSKVSDEIFTGTASGMFMIDFSKITDLSILMENI